MKAILALMCVVLVSATDFSGEWNSWKELHKKTYECEHEELARYTIWAANKAYIEEHNKNADTFGYTLKMNEFGDMVALFNSVHSLHIDYRKLPSLDKYTMDIVIQKANRKENSMLAKVTYLPLLTGGSRAMSHQ